MGQCFGRCCHSSRVQPIRSDSTISLTHKKGQAWIESDGNGIKDDTGDKNNISEILTLDEQTDGAAISEHVQPSEPFHDEIDGELEQVLIMRKSADQDQNNRAQFNQSSENQYAQGLITIPEVRSMIDVPNDFDYFIRQVIVPNFEQQRQYQLDKKQFAVLLLVTEEDLGDIRQMKFHPHDPPITNNCNLSMPDNEKDYHNYIVARPRNDNHHAEKEIFEHLDQLWKGFMRHNHRIPPKCFILYSWNFPCTKCTQLIIDSFNKPLYKSVSVIVAATAKWDKEKHKIRHRNEKKMEQERFHYDYYRPIKLPEHSSNNDS